jgi:hypothetical protein
MKHYNNKAIQQHFRRRWYIWAIVFLMIASFFLRSYHFQDWLFFSFDQSRDANLIKNAYDNGAENLPLLGPRAAGSFLRLGPVFYYSQFASAKIFNNVEPQTLAFPDFFFSLLTIPLLFYFLIQFFRRPTSLALTTIYTFSFIVIQYSRFAWNPNQTPFWGLLFLLGILKAKTAENRKQAGLWLILAALGFGIVSQLHFLALIGFAITGIIFLVFNFPKKINWKYWLGAFLVLFILYLPVFISDIKTSGDNLHQLKYVISNPSGTNDLGLKVKLIEDFKKITSSFTMILASFGNRDSFLAITIGSLLIIGGIFLLLKKYKEQDVETRSRVLGTSLQKAFVFLILTCFFVFLALYLKTDTSLKPRFFLPIIIIPFVFLGVFLEQLFCLKKRWLSMTALIIITFLLVIINLNAVHIWYSYFKTQNPEVIKRGVFMKQADGITLGKMKEASAFMIDKANQSNKMLCFYSDDNYKRSYEYIFSLHPPINLYDRLSHSMKNKEYCQYFSIGLTLKESSRISNRYSKDFDFENKNAFGLVAVWNLEPREVFLNWGKKKDASVKTEIEEDNIIIQEKSSTAKEPPAEIIKNEDKDKNEEDNKEENKKPRRMERVLWKDVFK